MANSFRVVLLCLTLAGATEVSAQLIVVYSVDGWPRMGTRADGKLEAQTFSFGVQHPAPAAPGAAAGRVNVNDFHMTIQDGDATHQFLRAALPGQPLKSVLIEHQLANATKGAPAPFAIRLLDVWVTSVQVGGNSGPEGYASVSLQAGRIEFFNTVQGPSGKPGPVNRLGYDVRSGKIF